MDIRDLLKLVTIGTDEECEACEFVICGPKSFFDDDVHTTCANCGAAIVHRPYVPTAPTKICMDCAALQIDAEKLPHA